MNSQSFCSFRWSDTLVNLSRGEVHSCCKTPAYQVSHEELKQRGAQVFDNSFYIQQRRQEMLLGIKHTDCSYCWRLEEKKMSHPRQRSHTLPSLFPKQQMDSWPSLAQEAAPFLKTPAIDQLEILLKNTCQLKCQYCNSGFSSSWEKEDRESGHQRGTSTSTEFQDDFLREFWNYLPQRLATLTEINIIGGEPLLQTEFYKLLDQIAFLKRQNPSPRLTISVISNLSISEKWMSIFLAKVEELKSVADFVLLASMDNTGSRAEYVRYGLEWPLFQKNIERACESNLFKTIRYIITMSAFNLSDLVHLLTYYKDLAQTYSTQSFELVPNVVHHPEHLAPFIVDASAQEYIDLCIEFLVHHQIAEQQSQEKFRQFLLQLKNQIAQNTQDSFPRQRAQFVRWVRHYDQLRKTNFCTTFPEFASTLKAWQKAVES